MCGRFTTQASWADYHNALRDFLDPAQRARGRLNSIVQMR
jgi:hypothetical protein